MIITDASKITYDHSNYNNDKITMHVPDEYLIPDSEWKYSALSKDFDLGMKPVGRLFGTTSQYLKYSDGTPVTILAVDGGEHGMADRYLKAGKLVYTEDQVKNIINSRCYEQNEELTPKITAELESFLKGIANNTMKDKPKKAKELLEKYSVIGKED